MNKDYYVQLNIQDDFDKHIGVVKLNETDSIVLNINLVQNGKPFDLSTASYVTMGVIKPDGNFNNGYCEIVDGPAGKVKYMLPVNCVNQTGVFRGEVQAFNNTSMISTAAFSYEVKNSLLRDEGVTTQPKYPILVELINDVQEAVTAESGRVTAEQGRVTAETGRVSAESARVTAESGRASAENTRVSQESTRNSQEASRVSTESARVTAESARVTAENARYSAETTRQSNETARVSAETSRANAESARVSAETSRAQAESWRASAETLRVSAENGRVTAEANRVSEFQQILDEWEAIQAADVRAEVIAARSGFTTLGSRIDDIKNYSNLTFYVNKATGSDSNDGLTSGTAFKTLQKAVDQIPSISNDVTINVADGDYSGEHISIIGKSGTSIIKVTGNGTTPANVILDFAHAYRCSCTITFEGMTAKATDTYGFYAFAVAYASMSNCVCNEPSENAGFAVDSTSATIANCVTNDRKYGVFASQGARLYSAYISGNATSYGLFINKAATVGTYGTQPTGTTGNVLLDTGGSINNDADTLDGKHASAFVLSTYYTAGDVLSKLLTVDGADSGLNADLLDDKHATDFFQASNYGAVQKKNASFTLALSDIDTVIVMYNATAATITIPTFATVAARKGATVTVIAKGAGTVTFAPASGVTLNSESTKRTIDGQYAWATLEHTAVTNAGVDDDNVWDLAGKLKA